MRALTTILFVFSLLLTTAELRAQAILISQGGSVEVTCGSTVDLTDTDANGPYANGETHTMTFCPGIGGSAVIFGIDTQTSMDLFDVAGSDLLSVYDGEDTNAPLIGSYNSNVFTGGLINLAASLENPSGCLTVVFETSEASIGGEGFEAHLTCGNFWQPFDLDFAVSPVELDTVGNYIDICQDTEITIVADGDFPFAGGAGYEQNNENLFFDWDFGDGTNESGIGLNSITHLYEGAFGYPIELLVTDTEGLTNRFVLKVRISTTPNFSGLLSQYAETICLGDNLTLTGGLTGVTTSGAGAIPTTGNFVSGGFLAGQTFLPDGAGGSYSTAITLADFPPGATLGDVEDLVSICATMEHSFLGDLDIELACPNGSSIVLQGQGGGSCNLGEPWATGTIDGDIFVTTPGVGYEYCWTPQATQGLEEGCLEGIEFINGDGPGTYIDSQVQEGDYAPDQSFDGLIGCPINGDWTITVTDNLTADNGYIFSWGITFSDEIQPEIETYLPQLVTGSWEMDETISVFSDTVITVQPTNVGDIGYTFNVTDDYGCDYDTTIFVTVIPPPSLEVTSPACNNVSEVIVSNTTESGFWQMIDAPEGAFLNFPIIDSSFTGGTLDLEAFGDPGVYQLSYTDLFCNRELEASIEFLPVTTADIPDTMLFCLQEGTILSAPEQASNLDIAYQWTNFQGEIVASTASFSTDQQGAYTLQVQDIFCGTTATDQIYAEVEICEIQAYNVVTPDGNGENDTFIIDAIEKFNNPELLVYNRWGKLIFEEVNYRNDWDMSDISEGTYFYVINNPQRNETFKGSFTVLR